MIIELANDAPVIVVDHWEPHPCGGWYVIDSEVLGLNWKARPAGHHAGSSVGERNQA